MKELISGAHVIISSSDAAADRAFFRDVLGFESVDAGGGWLIFALPPAELALHPGANSEHQLYLMCADLDATLLRLEGKGVPVKTQANEQSWGRIASILLPGGGELFIYQPSHPTPGKVSLDP
jgi:catechol 2,3-dioxygenase-like lactoylglutathione lyase family enzyme